MTRTLAVNSQNDIFIDSSGSLAISTQAQAVAENAEQALQTLLGEVFFASNRGLPNFQVTWDGAPNVLQFEAAARAELARVNNITEVRSFSAIVANNVMQYSATIITPFGEATING